MLSFINYNPFTKRNLVFLFLSIEKIVETQFKLKSAVYFYSRLKKYMFVNNFTPTKQKLISLGFKIELYMFN